MSDESEVVRNDREEARSEAMRHSATRHERLYGDNAPTRAELEADER